MCEISQRAASRYADFRADYLMKRNFIFHFQ